MPTMFIAYAFLMIVLIFQGMFNTLFWRSFDENSARMTLTFAVNSASDVATEYLLEESQETPYGNIFIEPNDVWEIYKYVMLKSMGLHSAKNMKEADYFFPTVLIVVNDGYFMRMLSQEERSHTPPGQTGNVVTSLEWAYRFSQKIPFVRQPSEITYMTGKVPELEVVTDSRAKPGFTGNASWYNNPRIPASTDTFPVIVSDTLNGANIIVYYPQLSSNRYIRYGVDGNRAISVKDSAHDKSDIAMQILKAIDYSMQWNAAGNSKYRVGGTVRIPTEIVHGHTSNLAGDNVSFIGPEIIIIADQFNWVGNHSMSFYTISNTQIVERAPHYCYVRNGQKYYSTRDPRTVAGGGVTVIDQIYGAMSQCAEAGYSPDLDHRFIGS